MSGLQLLMYVAVVVFVIGTAYKMLKIARMPLHLRWDLYPIPHERGKNKYGGSYFEETDWWTKPTNFSLFNEIKEMAKEIVFIQSMFHHNRSLWVFSFPFHIGLYCSVGFVGLLLLGSIMTLAGTAVTGAGTGLARLVFSATMIFGLVGGALMIIGAIGLFFSRLAKHELRAASVWTDYFNLLLLAAIGVTTLTLGLSVDPEFTQTRAFVTGLVSFGDTAAPTGVLATHLILASVFMLWLPLTHMTHFVGKYFTYHKVRWEDHPNVRGGKVEASISEALGYKITWAADHIKTGGTWAEAATATDKKEAGTNEK